MFLSVVAFFIWKKQNLHMGEQNIALLEIGICDFIYV